MIISYEMNLTKSFYIHYFGVCILLFVIALAAGCSGTVKPRQQVPLLKTTPPFESTAQISATPSPNATMNSCSIPELKFNNFHHSNTLSQMDPFSNSVFLIAQAKNYIHAIELIKKN